MKIYIAGPMTGLPDSNYPAFNAAAKAWRDAGWDVLNPAENFGGDASRSYLEYAEEDIKLLRQCDAIAMLPGWNGPTARGSVWEYVIAMRLLGLMVFDAEKVAPPVLRRPAGWPPSQLKPFFDELLPNPASVFALLDG